MIYIIGSEGFLGKKITKIFDKKKLIKISTKKQQNNKINLINKR